MDLVFGPQTIHRLPAMIAALRATREPQVDVSFPEIEKFDRLPEPRAHGRDRLRIDHGRLQPVLQLLRRALHARRGDQPPVRTGHRAKSARSSEQGVREMTLLGQNVNAYRGPAADGTVVDLADAHPPRRARSTGLERIRFTTSHPLEFTQALVEAYADVPKLANYLHLPVQSGSDRILALMKRGYTRLEYKQKIRRLRAVRPDISLSSDFIVGFPGETEADFAADAGADRGRRLRPVVQLHLQQAARDARRLAAGRSAA